jgi:purine-binding chemotaxis protein CheW
LLSISAGESGRDLLTMPMEASLSALRLSVVLVRAGDLLCALPIASVIETLRSPPIMAIAGTPGWVRGVAVIRGATVAVVDLGILLGSGAGAREQPRVITLRVGSRIVGLAVDSIVGVREFERSLLSDVPPMLRHAHAEVLTAIGMLDRELLMVLDGSRIITELELEGLEASR